MKTFCIVVITFLSIYSKVALAACPPGGTPTWGTGGTPSCITTSAASTAGQNGMLDAYNVKSSQFGAFCDGGSHTLGSVYGNIAAARAKYPFALDLSQQIDYMALQLASNTALGVPGSENGNGGSVNNRPIYIPHGTCILGNDVWRIRNSNGLIIFGDGKTNTQLQGNGIILQTNGLWYSRISDMFLNGQGSGNSQTTTVTISNGSPAVMTFPVATNMDSATPFKLTGTLPSPLNTTDTYWTCMTSTTTANICRDPINIGGVVNTTTAGTPPFTFTSVARPTKSGVSFTSNVLNVGTADGFYGGYNNGANGTAVVFSSTGTLPTPLSANHVYWICGADTSSLAAHTSQIRSSLSDANCPMTGISGGSGTLTVTAVVPTSLDIDGNTSLAPYSTLGVQSVVIDNFLAGASNGNQAMAVSVCRAGGSSGQCSESQFRNMHTQGGGEAAYLQSGGNALDNIILGGDLQSFSKNGFELLNGAFSVYRTSFEAGTASGYAQVRNGGCDIQASQSGAEDSIGVYGARSESLCLYNGAFPQWADIHGFAQSQPPGAIFSSWFTGTHYNVDDMVIGIIAGGAKKAFRVTVAGTSAGTEPTWPSSGTVTDSGGVTWINQPYIAISFPYGTIDLQTSYIHESASVNVGAPSVSSGCGSGATVAGTKYNGSVTEGSGNPLTCTISILSWFGLNCSVFPLGNGSAASQPVTSVTGNLTFTHASNTGTGAGFRYGWSCGGNP